MVDVDIEDEKTPWCTFKLSDGTTLKIRLNLINVSRAGDAWDQHDGNPIYFYKTNMTVRLVGVPKELKAKRVGERKLEGGMEVR